MKQSLLLLHVYVHYKVVCVHSDRFEEYYCAYFKNITVLILLGFVECALKVTIMLFNTLEPKMIILKLDCIMCK